MHALKFVFMNKSKSWIYIDCNTLIRRPYISTERITMRWRTTIKSCWRISKLCWSPTFNHKVIKNSSRVVSLYLLFYRNSQIPKLTLYRLSVYYTHLCRGSILCFSFITFTTNTKTILWIKHTFYYTNLYLHFHD